jgi:CRISPR/Cas system-associated protein endoribonuclease Cas2
MKFEDIVFPVYRRYKNGRSYFKIINERAFEEVRPLGSKRIVSLTDAKQFPEMNFIRDLVFNYSEMADEISAEEYEKFKS